MTGLKIALSTRSRLLNKSSGKNYAKRKYCRWIADKRLKTGSNLKVKEKIFTPKTNVHL